MTSTVQETLPTCVLPGCRQLVPAWGEVCDGCRTACGDYLVAVDRPPLTQEQVEARDAGIRAAYAAQLAPPPPAPAAESPERHRSQVCWMCEDRRTCTQVAGRWECDPCQAVTP